MILLLAAAFVLGLASLQHTRELAAEEFQQQQLILARVTARQLEDGLAFLRRELKILNYSPAIQYLDQTAWANRMGVSFEELAQLGVQAIERRNFTGPKAGQVFVLDRSGSHRRTQPPGDSPEVPWAQDPTHRGRIYHGPIKVSREDKVTAPIMVMATPVFEESVDESHPVPSGNLVGMLSFRVDVAVLAAHFCQGIRSGRTGYCWVINDQGIFIYHPEREFIGEDAFTARVRRNPLISFDKINEIQKTRMLAGEEGTAQYTSGRHRGVIRPMEKFLAFSVARLAPENPGIWAVAVAAPTDEVWGAISSLYVRQFLLQGLLIFALLLAAAAVIYYELRWSAELKGAVDRTTVDLRRSEAQYKSVVENARDFIFLVDAGGALISANLAAAQAFGVSAGELPGKSLAEFFPPDDAAALLQLVGEVFDGKKSLEAQATVRLKDRDYWLSTHFVPLFGEDGVTVERALVMARDMTDRQRLEEQMALTEKLASMGTLAAGVAHEMNNPLGIMLGFTELLLDRIRGPRSTSC